MDLRPFTQDDVPAAAALLAERPNAHPLAVPLDAAAEIGTLLDDGATGYVTDGGYLLGSVKDGEAWCHLAGHAARDVATYRHLYRAAARDWVAAGLERHVVLMPDGDPVGQEAFANLAFGREHVYALAALDDQPHDEPDPRFGVRLGTPDDLDLLRPFFTGMLARHLSAEPVWAPRPASYYDTIVARFSEHLADGSNTYLIAWVDGEVAGFATWEPTPPTAAVPEGTYTLGHAVLRPDLRGRGAGRALTLAGLRVARERGYTITWTDWRLTNMTAEPYWRTYGWTPYEVRYTRRVAGPGLTA